MRKTINKNEYFSLLKKQKNKYKNNKIIIDNIKFDSISEGNRYCELKILLKQNKIKNLILQPSFVLQENFIKCNIKFRKIKYIADFQYFDNEKKQIIVEDVKGYKTKEFKLKYKLFEYKYKDLTLKIIK